MTVRTKLREKHCEFLSDPEGFIEKAKSGSTKNVITLRAWLTMVAFYVILLFDQLNFIVRGQQ